MILKALYDYYQKHENELPPLGTELKEIGFVLVLDKEGNFLRFEDNRTENKKNAKGYLVKQSVNRSSGAVANYLYDNSEYVLGYSTECKNKEKLHQKHSLFIKQLENAAEEFPFDTALKAVNGFYSQDYNYRMEAIIRDPLWPEIIKNLDKKYSNFSFRLQGEKDILAERSDLFPIKSGEFPNGRCLITGKIDEIVDLTSATMIPGSQAIAKLVAFQVKSGYDSYGKEQGRNAPIGKTAEFCYTTALKSMLAQGSRHKFGLGDRTFVFWTSSDSEEGKSMEMEFNAIMNIDSSDKEEGPENVEGMRKTFASIYSGVKELSSDDRFYVLGMSPNSARIAVVHWTDLPLKEFSGNIIRHFDDMEIVDIRKEKKPYNGVRQILSAITRGGKVSDSTPNLPEAIANSIFHGSSYPFAVFAACIRRLKSEGNVSVSRAAILKGFLNRKYRNTTNKITFMLDTTNTTPSYLCGRLFAVIEKMQQDANNINSVKDSYLSGAASTPGLIFPRLLKLSTHYGEKLTKGREIFFNRLIQEIMGNLKNEFPRRLDLEDQGRFFLGYYHQMADFFRPSTEIKGTGEGNE
ncbi:MAG: type I-C CRISPR-associated protein Cas8c/Csd1 [Muribaculaceae bacterium]|nr:type I-C CRISPR-associated protein Cas8c/Csd1 [Muribaculaceae bacterium]